MIKNSNIFRHFEPPPSYINIFYRLEIIINCNFLTPLTLKSAYVICERYLLQHPSSGQICFKLRYSSEWKYLVFGRLWCLSKSRITLNPLEKKRKKNWNLISIDVPLHCMGPLKLRFYKKATRFDKIWQNIHIRFDSY